MNLEIFKRKIRFRIRVFLYFAIIIGSFFYNFCYRPIEGNPLMTNEYKKSSSYVNNLYVSDDYFKNALHFSDLEEQYYDLAIHGKITTDGCPLSSCEGIDFHKVSYVRELDHPEFIFPKKVIGGSKEIVVSNLRLRWFEREMDDIRKKTKKMSDQDKILFVYKYMVENREDFFYGDLIANDKWYNYLASYSELFGGYPALAQVICQNIGIKSYIVYYINDDYAKPLNIVEYEGKYYYFDSTFFFQTTDPNNLAYYDGLVFSPDDGYTLLYKDLYPQIENKSLKEVFGL
ncbi:MAG: hypothetical protein IKF71_01550 [Bacilli bacterium]|nr:hypothetical protein [Bacilli bacterium]